MSSLLLALFIVVFVQEHAWCCKCAPPPPYATPANRAICNSLPDRNEEGSAIFVGTVVDVYPNSAQHLADIWEKFGGGKYSEEDLPSLAEWKGIVLQMWRDTLTASEIKQVLAAESDDALERLLDNALGWAVGKRVRLNVSEVFAGARRDTFELFTGMGGGDCGIPFEAGRSYLVFASRNRDTGRWTSTICSRTSALPYAEEDVRTLRAWRSGTLIPPRIYGAVWKTDGDHDDEPVPDAEVHLSGKDIDRRGFTDIHGRFLFDDLPPLVYRVRVQVPGWHLSSSDANRQVDLSAGRCSELNLDLEPDKR